MSLIIKRKVFILLYFLLVSGGIILVAQDNPSKNKPVTDNEQIEQNKPSEKEINGKTNEGENIGNSKAQGKEKDEDKDNGASEVKKVKGSSLDMSKSRGARPPTIIRPSGSQIPQGAGKPSGARRPGKR